MIESLVSTLQALGGEDPHETDEHEGTPLYLYVSIGVLVIFAPLTWVRRIQRFKFGYIFGVLMILVAVVTVSVYCI